MERKTYSQEFKEEAVKLSSQREVPMVQIARELGIPPKLLYRWRSELKELGPKAFPGKGKPRDEELYELRRELERVKQERDILKKAMSVFARDVK